MLKTLITESVSIDQVTDAIDNHYRVIINYHSKGEDVSTGSRVIEVYAYGLTKAGNPVIRGFQPYGDSRSGGIPAWRFFRLDRISSWKPTKQTFDRPADFFYKGLGDFNPNGDETMSVVYKIAKFGNEQMPQDLADLKANMPKMKDQKSDKVFKTDTEIGMERLRQQLQNPITLSDLKVKNGFNKNKEAPQQSGPKLKPQPTTDKSQNEPYKTDTERGMERLRQQLQNPLTLDDYMKQRYPSSQQNRQSQKTPTNNSAELDNLRQKLGDTSQPIPFKELNKRLSSNEPYKTDTERGMERLRQQLQNPKKIDLSRIPKK